MSNDETDPTEGTDPTAAGWYPPNIPERLTPLGPKIAATDPDRNRDDWESFKLEADAICPGIDISNLDPGEVARWIDGIRRANKRKGHE